MKQVFVDSGAFFALLVADDAFHKQSVDLFRRADSERWQLVTTNLVVVETYTLLLARTRRGRYNAIAFLDSLDTSDCSVERVSADDEVAGIAIVRAHQDKTYSLCDAISFAVMERLGITEAVSFDRHFREYGKFMLL